MKGRQNRGRKLPAQHRGNKPRPWRGGDASRDRRAHRRQIRAAAMGVTRRTRRPAARRVLRRLRAPGPGPQTPRAAARQETLPLEVEGHSLSPAGSLAPNQGGGDGGRRAYWTPSGDKRAPASTGARTGAENSLRSTSAAEVAAAANDDSPRGESVLDEFPGDGFPPAGGRRPPQAAERIHREEEKERRGCICAEERSNNKGLVDKLIQMHLHLREPL